MAETQNKQQDLIQVFDYYVNREYYKMLPRLFHTVKEIVRTDRIKNWKEWHILCEDMPDKIRINGEEYELVKKSSFSLTKPVNREVKYI